MPNFPANVQIVNDDGTATPEFLRALNATVQATSVPGGTSSGGDPAVGGIGVPAFSMLPVSSGGPASRLWEYPNTNPNTWNTRSGMMTFKGKFTVNSYFAANPGAHFIIGLRVDVAALALGDVRFHGVACGDLVGALEGCPHYPAMQIESRATGLAGPTPPQRQLIPNAWTPSGRLLEDGKTYDLLIQSKIVASDRRTIRFVLSEYEGANLSYNIVADTGDCLDPNPSLDMTKSALVFASVFESNLVPWSIAWFDMSVTWSSAPDAATDDTPRISRYGDKIAGPLSWTAGQLLKIYCTGTAFNDWTAIESQTTNGDTTMLAKPNGTSTVAGFMAANKSDITGLVGLTSLQMDGARAKISNIGLNGHANPPLDVEIGGSTHRFSATGLKITGKTLEIGPASARLVGPFNLGGANAMAFSGAFNYEQLCTPGAIGAYLGGAPTGDMIEMVLRPLYAHLSQHFADARDNGTG